MQRSLGPPERASDLVTPECIEGEVSVDEGVQRPDRIIVKARPCPNCAAPVDAEWTPGAAAKCKRCGHEFTLGEPLEYWDEGQWDEGLR